MATIISDAEITGLGERKIVLASWAGGEVWLDARGGHISGRFNDGGVIRDGLDLHGATTTSIHRKLAEWMVLLPGLRANPR